MRKPKVGEVVKVYDDLKNCHREAAVTSLTSQDPILGITFEIRFLDNNMENTAYWSIFRQSWSKLNVGGQRPVMSKEILSYSEEEYND